MSFDCPIVKLGDYCTKIGSGATPKGGNSVYLDHGEISLIRSQNIYNEGFKSEGLVYITPEAAQKLKNVIIESNDVLINITGDSVARVCLAPNEFLPARVNQHVAILRVDPEEFDHRYLRYFLTSTKMQNYLLTIASTGGTRNALTKSMLESLEVSKPSLDVQKRIGNVLENFESKIELNSRTNQTLEQMAQAIFKSWFVDFDPVKAKMNGEQPEGMDAATASLFPEKLVESELGLIPEGWEAKPLGDYLTIKRGGSPRPIKDFIVPDGYPWTKIADATANDNPYIFKTKEFIKEEGLKKTVYLKKGTLILSNSATPGLPRFLELDACIHDGWLHFPEKKHFTDSYLYQLFLHIRKHLVSQGNGSVFTNLKTDILRNQVVLVPPKELVDIYEKHAGKFLEAVKAKSIESNQLAQLRDTLLPKLLSGEIELEGAGVVEENDVVNRLLKQMDFGVKFRPRQESIPEGSFGYISLSGTFGFDGGTFVSIPKAVQALTKITSADGIYSEIVGNALTENILSGTVELATNNIIPLGVLTKICTAVFGKKTPIKPRNAVLLTSIHQAKKKTLDGIMNEQAKRFKFLEQSSMDEQEFGESLRYLESIGVVKCEGQHIALLDTIVQH